MQTKRILLKISGETLKQKSESNFDYNFMKKLAKKILLLKNKWYEIVIVTWWGNIFRWSSDSKWVIDEATWHYMWMLATLMNWMALWDILSKIWIETKVLSVIDAPRLVPIFNRKLALDYLNEWKIVIATAWTWNPYCTNDLAAVIRANELNCDLFIKSTKVDWVYDKDPMKYKDAKKFDKITLKKAYELWLNIMDHSAIALAMDTKLPIFVCKVDDIEKLWTDEIIWTYLS